MHYLTLEEQERRAYADGDVERAALLRLAIDATDELTAVEDMLTLKPDDSKGSLPPL